MNNVFKILDECSVLDDTSGKFMFDNILIENSYLKFDSFGFGNVSLDGFKFSLVRELDDYFISGNINLCLELNKVNKIYS